MYQLASLWIKPGYGVEVLPLWLRVWIYIGLELGAFRQARLIECKLLGLLPCHKNFVFACIPIVFPLDM